jgi:hypothetical protein
MSKILLALVILSAGAVGFFATHQSTSELMHDTTANRGAWLVQTQQLGAVRQELAELAERVRELKASPAGPPAAKENKLWTAVQKGNISSVAPQLLEELGFNWQTSPDFIVVTKPTVRNTRGWTLQNGRLTKVAAAVLALTPEERAPVEATFQRAQAEFDAWALAHVQRMQPQSDELAHYFLPADPAMLKRLREIVDTGVSAAALGQERKTMLNGSFDRWHEEFYGLNTTGASLLIPREPNSPAVSQRAGQTNYGAIYTPGIMDFRPAFLPVFPNGWADVAKREGFELPEEPPKK